VTTGTFWLLRERCKATLTVAFVALWGILFPPQSSGAGDNNEPP